MTLSSVDQPWDGGPFNGAKLALLHEEQILTLLRDDVPHIPFPGHWDLPGGGREGDESPCRCALRELYEELGLRLPATRVTGRSFPSAHRPGRTVWLYTGAITQAEISTLQLGDEGQAWRMMPLAEFMLHPKVIPHFPAEVRAILGLD